MTGTMTLVKSIIKIILYYHYQKNIGLGVNEDNVKKKYSKRYEVS